MANQMKMRIGNAPEGVTFPVWAWYQWEGKRKRPDMRIHGRSWSKKGRIFCISIRYKKLENYMLY